MGSFKTRLTNEFFYSAVDSNITGTGTVSMEYLDPDESRRVLKDQLVALQQCCQLGVVLSLLVCSKKIYLSRSQPGSVVVYKTRTRSDAS